MLSRLASYHVTVTTAPMAISNVIAYHGTATEPTLKAIGSTFTVILIGCPTAQPARDASSLAAIKAITAVRKMAMVPKAMAHCQSLKSSKRVKRV